MHTVHAVVLERFHAVPVPVLDVTVREALPQFVLQDLLADGARSDLILGQIQTDQSLRLHDGRQKVAETLVAYRVASKVENRQILVDAQGFGKLICSDLHDAVTVVAARFTRRQTQVLQGVVLAKGVRQVADAFPLDTIHVEVEVDNVTGALEGLGDLDHAQIAQLIEAQVVRCNVEIEHHKLAGEDARRVFFEVAIRQIQTPIFGLLNQMDAELLELV